MSLKCSILFLDLEVKAYFIWPKPNARQNAKTGRKLFGRVYCATNASHSPIPIELPCLVSDDGCQGTAAGEGVTSPYLAGVPTTAADTRQKLFCLHAGGDGGGGGGQQRCHRHSKFLHFFIQVLIFFDRNFCTCDSVVPWRRLLSGQRWWCLSNSLAWLSNAVKRMWLINVGLSEVVFCWGLLWRRRTFTTGRLRMFKRKYPFCIWLITVLRQIISSSSVWKLKCNI